MGNGRNRWARALLVVVCGALGGCAGGADLAGDYLGQEPPGAEARLFARGLVSTGMNDRDVAVSPDGDEIYFAVVEAPHYSIVRMHRRGGRWHGPEIASCASSMA